MLFSRRLALSLAMAGALALPAFAEGPTEIDLFFPVPVDGKLDAMEGVADEIEAWLKDPNREATRKQLGLTSEAAYREALSAAPKERPKPGLVFVALWTVAFLALLATTPWVLDHVLPETSSPR